MTRTILFLVALVAAAPAGAEAPQQDSQMVRQIALGLRAQGIVADLSGLTRPQATALLLELSSSEDEPGQDIRSRQTLLDLLRGNPATPVLRQ